MANTSELFYLISRNDFEEEYTSVKSYAKDYDEEKTTYTFEFKVPGEIEHFGFDFGAGDHKERHLQLMQRS